MRIKLPRTAVVILLLAASFLSYGGCNKSNGSGINGGGGGDLNLFTPVVLSVPAQPVPVKGSDGLFHLVYELVLTNYNNFNWEVLSVEVLDGDENGSVIHSFSGDEVMNNMELVVGPRVPANMLEPGQTGKVFITFDVDSAEEIPKMLTHRLTITVPGGLPEFIVAFLQLPPGQDALVETGAMVGVSTQEVIELGPPLEGTGWLALNGLDTNVHRRSAQPVNGKINISQRFAIDWLKVNDENRLFVGDPRDTESWFGYGENVLAVAEGLVVSALDKFSDKIPLTLPADEGAITLEEFTGNHVILELGNGQHAFYAHLKPGSIQVKVGDFVTRGQVLGLLGNTGNTGAPHLHFHIMERNSSLGSNGLPYTYDEFNLVGIITEDFFDIGLEDTNPGNSIEILPVQNPGIHNDELPLSFNVINFSLSPN